MTGTESSGIDLVRGLEDKLRTSDLIPFSPVAINLVLCVLAHKINMTNHSLKIVICLFTKLYHIGVALPDFNGLRIYNSGYHR